MVRRAPCRAARKARAARAPPPWVSGHLFRGSFAAVPTTPRAPWRPCPPALRARHAPAAGPAGVLTDLAELRRGERRAVHLRRHGLAEEGNGDDESKAVLLAQDPALVALERAVDHLHLVAGAEVRVRDQRRARALEDPQRAELALQLALGEDLEQLHDEIALESPQARLGAAAEEDVAGEQRQVRDAPAVAGAEAVLPLRQVEGHLRLQQVAREPLLLAAPHVRHPPRPEGRRMRAAPGTGAVACGRRLRLVGRWAEEVRRVDFGLVLE